MYYGIGLMENLRDFKLPWNLFATSNNSCKPGGWRYIRKSMCVFRLKNLVTFLDIYDKEKFKPMFRPKCNCKPDSGCRDGCLNRFGNKCKIVYF